MKYEMRIIGCDAETSFEIELTAEELATVERIVKVCNKTAEYSCEPTMAVTIKKDD